MTTVYRGHDIQVTGSLIPDTARWTVKVVIHWMNGDADESRRFGAPPSGFKSKPEAERWGLDFAQQWINDGKPDLHKPHAPK